MNLIVIGENVFYEITNGYLLYLGKKGEITRLSNDALVSLVQRAIAEAKGFILLPEPRMVQ